MYQNISVIVYGLFALAITMLSSSVDVMAADAVARWDFGSEEQTPLSIRGNVKRDQAGPRAPEFPDFSTGNTAVRFDASGYLEVTDPGVDSMYDFTNGDTISIEAWVHVDPTGGSSPMYVVGKGRSDAAKFARDNQNWALRVVSKDSMIKMSFLFASTPKPGGSHWHRWTSAAGFDAQTGWHHLAVSYRFGTPESIRGWIDGRPSKGTWDMGGATKSPPVVDNDVVAIGASRSGSPGNSFKGMIDSVAIHRSSLDDATVASRFNRVGGPRTVELMPEVMPEIASVPTGRVSVSIAEGLPSEKRWLNEGESWPTVTDHWTTDHFLLPRIPVRYDSWGIRESWNAPVLVTMAADVQLPTGTNQFLLRTRSLGRLWVDGTLIARTATIRRRTGNLEPVVPVPTQQVPDARVAGFHQQEVFGEYRVAAHKQASTDTASKQTVRVVLEFVVGGKQLRTESGEVCVAIKTSQDDWYDLLSPPADSRVPLTETAMRPLIKQIDESLVRHQDRTRRSAAVSQDEFWENRHAIARNSDRIGEPNQGPHQDRIDRLISSKIDQAVSSATQHDRATTRQFHDQVLPILSEHCFRCHGEKKQGGLRLNSRQHALAAGESEQPAVVPGSPEGSELIQQIRSGAMPPTDDGLNEQQITILETWIRNGAVWPSRPVPAAVTRSVPLVSDAAFLRRVFLDTVGVPPQQHVTAAFIADRTPDKRARIIDQLLADDRIADHWVSFWMDLLAENPTLLNGSLNSTGPFRWFLYESLRDGKPIDRMVTELILMRGSVGAGGSAGFGVAAENDSPLAAKAHILSSAFLGIELQCARCHDSPYHSTTQADLYSIAAMLGRKSLTPPKTSRVPDEFFENKGRQSLIRVTLELGQQVTPKWPFADFTGNDDSTSIDRLVQEPADSRERLAALITSPDNKRFPRVIVNHLWKRLIGTGFVEPVNDWEGKSASHPILLDWLADELVTHDYDARHVMRLIMTSDVYQRESVGDNLVAPADQRFFNAPDPRRLTAEQIVDSLFTSADRKMDVEELTFVHDGSDTIERRMTLGVPRRAWMFASLNNERDRPSLSLPRAQPIVDVLQAFGWTGSRQKPIAQRDTAPNVLQPGILANGTLTTSITRAADQSVLASLAVNANTAEELVDAVFLRFLVRHPTPTEWKTFSTALGRGFDARLAPTTERQPPPIDTPLPQVTWSNHLVPETTEIQYEVQRRVRRGPHPDPRLSDEWREVYEDVLWSLVNDREFVWVP